MTAFDLPQRGYALHGLENSMATRDELQLTAHEIYARARATSDPLKKQELLNLADDYLKRADQLRHGDIVQAAFPKVDRIIK